MAERRRFLLGEVRLCELRKCEHQRLRAVGGQKGKSYQQLPGTERLLCLHRR